MRTRGRSGRIGDIAVPTVTKVLVGRDLTEGEFSFKLCDEQGEELSGAVNDADGAVTFEPIGYTLADAGETFTYTISEEPGSATGVTYDSNEITLTVSVSKDGKGNLVLDASYDPEDASFENVYKAPARPNAEVPGTGDTLPFPVIVLLMVGVALASIGTGLCLRRN